MCFLAFNLRSPSLLLSEPREEAPAPLTLAAAVTSREGETIFDFCWYPYMMSAGCGVPDGSKAVDPSTCAFVSVARDHPVHMFDAYTGAVGQSASALTPQRRASYAGFDDTDEVTPAPPPAGG